MIQSEGMEDKITPTEIILGRLFGWQSVDFSVTKIMGVKKPCVENLNEQYPVMRCRISLKVNYLHSHVENFTLI
jgi:hypothetical protein